MKTREPRRHQGTKTATKKTTPTSSSWLSSCLRVFVVSLYSFLVAATAVAQSTAPTAAPAYETRRATRDGTGKIYMGREIAQVMGHQGADWLERPEREREEGTNLLVDNMD